MSQSTFIRNNMETTQYTAPAHALTLSRTTFASEAWWVLQHSDGQVVALSGLEEAVGLWTCDVSLMDGTFELKLKPMEPTRHPS